MTRGWVRPRRTWIGSTLLLATIVAAAGTLASWKRGAMQAADAAAASQPEPAESVTVALASEREHRDTTTSIGTVLALRSVTLRNELPGTVRDVRLVPGRIVEKGAVLVALDVSVEEAELKALEAQAALAQTTFGRLQPLRDERAIPEISLDQARAERDVALAQIARTQAIIARKTIRAPFRGRIGLSDVHPGQYLDTGTALTTLQGVDEDAHVDFTVVQHVAAGLRKGHVVEVIARDAAPPIRATVVAIDARVDPSTRNALVRARIDEGSRTLVPGGSVRVNVPIGPPRVAIAVPASALRKGPGGDHVFVIARDDKGASRAHVRPVRSGAMLDDQVVIDSGLAAGEQVATSGSFKLRDAALVSVAGESALQASR